MVWRTPTITEAFHIAGYVISATCVSILFQHHVATWSTASGASMFPTLPEQSTYAIVSRRHRNGRHLKVGDIIEAENPLFLNRPVGKRIIGMPGDYVVSDSSTSPTVGGAYIPGLGMQETERQEPVMMQVPEGHVWVVGDNLGWSRDSRFYGPIPMALIRGKIIASGTNFFSLSSLSRPWMTKVGELESLEAKMKLMQEMDEKQNAQQKPKALD